MSPLADLLFELIHPIIDAVLAVFGYDSNWDPKRQGTRRMPRILSIFICFALSAMCVVGAIWLVWWLLT